MLDFIVILKWLPRILESLALLYLILILAATTFAYRFLSKSRVNTSRQALKRCLDRKEFPPEVLELPWENEKVFSPRRNADLALWFLPGKPGAGTVIALHGITWDHYVGIKYTLGFIERGWNAVVIDLGGHGDSPEGRLPSPGYGYYEKYDLDAVVDWARARFSIGAGNPGPLVIAGESMGAATALQYIPLGAPGGRDRQAWKVDAFIADCSYSTMADQTIVLNKLAHIPAFVAYPSLGLLTILTKIFRGFSIADVSPIKASLSSPAPVLFIHGGEDRFVPTWMSVRMAEARKKAGLDATKLVIIDGAAHASSVLVDRDKWFAEAFAFIEKYCTKAANTDG